MCNASSHTLPSREAVEDASSSSYQASPSLSHIRLFGPPVSQTGNLKSISVSSFRNYVQGEERAHLENISGEEKNSCTTRPVGSCKFARICVDCGGSKSCDDCREVQMSGKKKGLIVSPTCSVAGSCIRNKKSSPCGPYFPATFHFMDAVRKHTLSIGSK